MSMLLYILLGYYCLSALIIVSLMMFCLYGGQCEWANEYRQRMNGWKSHCLVFLVLLIGSPIFLPLLISRMPGIWRECAEEAEYWQEIRSEFKPLSLEPLHSANVDNELREFFDRQSECLEALGYSHLGEVWIKDSEPQWSKGKFWLSPSQDHIAEIMQVFDTQSCEITSFLEDGSVVSTASCQSADFFRQMTPYGYFIHCHPGFDMDELVAAHLKRLEECVGCGNQLRRIEPDQWKDYLRYSSRRFAEVSYEIDGTTEVPDEIVFPEAPSAPLSVSEARS